MINFRKIERFFAFAYILFLPIRVFGILNNVIPSKGVSTYIDFYIHIIGLILMLINSKNILIDKKTFSVLKNLFILVIFLSLISFIMSLILYSKHGVMFNEDSFSAISGQFIYFIHYLLIIVYNFRVLSIVKKHEIYKIFIWIILCNIIIGYIQLLIIKNAPYISFIYDNLNILGIYNDSIYLIKEGRITLFGLEPAFAGATLTRIVFPIILARIVFKGIDNFSLMLVILLLPILYFTKSTNAYLLFIFELFIFTILYLKRNNFKFESVIVFFGLIIIILSISISLFPSFFYSIYQYSLLKLIDKTNISTVIRTIPIEINFRIFLEYPFLGVGNGNQGFYTLRFLPQWAKDVVFESKSIYLSMNSELSNGVLFLPSIFSGYGIVGFSALLLFCAKLVSYAKSKKEYLGLFYFVFVISSITILVNSFSSDFVGLYEVWFMLSLPFISEGRKEV